MSVREALNRRPLAVSAATVATAVLVVSIIYASGRPGNVSLSVAGRLYFTVDDGKTFFADDSSNIAPFDYDGKQADQAAVFQCGQGEPFVGYLLRYPPRAKEALEAFPPEARQTASGALAIRKNYVEVKKPGASKWVPLGTLDPNSHVGDILNVEGPPGSSGDPQQVLPP